MGTSTEQQMGFGTGGKLKRCKDCYKRSANVAEQVRHVLLPRQPVPVLSPKVLSMLTLR